MHVVCVQKPLTLQQPSGLHKFPAYTFLVISTHIEAQQ